MPTRKCSSEALQTPYIQYTEAIWGQEPRDVRTCTCTFTCRIHCYVWLATCTSANFRYSTESRELSFLCSEPYIRFCQWKYMELTVPQQVRIRSMTSHSHAHSSIVYVSTCSAVTTILVSGEECTYIISYEISIG